MQLGFVGPGKMGGNMVLRLAQGSPDGKIKGGHTIVGFAKDPNPDVANVAGITTVDSLEKMVKQLSAPRTVWVMVPAGDATEGVVTQLATLLQEGDCIIDGGN